MIVQSCDFVKALSEVVCYFVKRIAYRWILSNLLQSRMRFRKSGFTKSYAIPFPRPTTLSKVIRDFVSQALQSRVVF